MMQHPWAGRFVKGGSVMPAAWNDLTQGVWIKLLLLSVTLPLLSVSAVAQIPAPSSSSGTNPLMPGLSLGEKEKRQLTPEEQERQKQLDADYKKATNKIPDQKATDPWGGVRPTPTAKGQSKQSLTTYHRDTFDKQTPQ
jgi:hypothetical protein